MTGSVSHDSQSAEKRKYRAKEELGSSAAHQASVLSLSMTVQCGALKDVSNSTSFRDVNFDIYGKMNIPVTSTLS